MTCNFVQVMGVHGIAGHGVTCIVVQVSRVHRIAGHRVRCLWVQVMRRIRSEEAVGAGGVFAAAEALEEMEGAELAKGVGAGSLLEGGEAAEGA